MDYKFNDLINDLNDGREIEFFYKNSHYGIVNRMSDPAWYICKDNIRISEYKDNPVDLLEHTKLEGVSLEEIFDNLLYDGNGLCIL